MRFTYIRGKGFKVELEPQLLAAVIMLIQLLS